MTEINNLEILTEKIYQEGIEKAEKDAKTILAKAETERNEILEKARAESDKIINEAKKEAARISRSTEKELELKGKQLISDLKNEIKSILSDKIIEKNTKGAFADTSFLQSAILEAIKSWQPDEELEIVLPKELEKKLKSTFSKSIGSHAKNLTVTFGDKLTGGFRITEKSGGYQISFTEEDFVALFTPYLNRQIHELLFERQA